MSEYILFNKTEGVLNQVLGLAEPALPELEGTADAGVIPVAQVVNNPSKQISSLTSDELLAALFPNS